MGCTSETSALKVFSEVTKNGQPDIFIGDQSRCSQMPHGKYDNINGSAKVMQQNHVRARISLFF